MLKIKDKAKLSFVLSFIYTMLRLGPIVWETLAKKSEKNYVKGPLYNVGAL